MYKEKAWLKIELTNNKIELGDYYLIYNGRDEVNRQIHQKTYIIIYFKTFKYII